MNILLTENQLITLIEQTDAEYEYMSMQQDIVFDIFQNIRRGKKIKFTQINPLQYKKALSEFIRYHEFLRFPTQIILEWKEILLYDIGLLCALTDIHGHSSSFPFDEFYDIFTEDFPEGQKRSYDWDEAYTVLDEKYHIDDYVPFFSNGHYVLTDYGRDPLEKLAFTLSNQTDPKEIIVTINKILDVSHQRSDLPELFIEGGSASLDFISN